MLGFFALLFWASRVMEPNRRAEAESMVIPVAVIPNFFFFLLIGLFR
jgi:hypothetical protein